MVLSHSILGFLGLREVPRGWESSGEKGMGSEGTRGGRCAAWGHLGRGLIAPVGGLCTLGGPPWLPPPAPSALTSKVLVSSARGPRPRLWLQPGPGPGSATRRPWVRGVPGAVGSGGGVMVWGAAWCSPNPLLPYCPHKPLMTLISHYYAPISPYCPPISLHISPYSPHKPLLHPHKTLLPPYNTYYLLLPIATPIAPCKLLLPPP